MTDGSPIGASVRPTVVAPDDDGIRPAGPPDACFYCRATVGTPHRFECVTVTTRVVYDVELDGVEIGEWHNEEPASWTLDQCEFHRNEGSWCTDNMAEQGVVVLRDGVEMEFPEDEDEPCLCSRVRLYPRLPN